MNSELLKRLFNKTAQQHFFAKHLKRRKIWHDVNVDIGIIINGFLVDCLDCCRFMRSKICDYSFGISMTKSKSFIWLLCTWRFRVIDTLVKEISLSKFHNFNMKLFKERMPRCPGKISYLYIVHTRTQLNLTWRNFWGNWRACGDWKRHF